MLDPGLKEKAMTTAKGEQISPNETPAAVDTGAGAGVPEPAKQPAVKPGAAKHPDPTRYGDWERSGRCIDF